MLVGTLNKYRRISRGECQRPPKIVLQKSGEHECRQNGDDRYTNFAEPVGDHPECRGHQQFERRIRRRIDAGEGEGEHAGNRIQAGTSSRRANSPTSGRFSTSSMMLPIYMEAIRPQAISGSLGEQERARRDRVHHEGPEHDRCRARARNAESEHRYHRSGLGGIVGGLGRGKAAHVALAKGPRSDTRFSAV